MKSIQQLLVASLVVSTVLSLAQTANSNNGLKATRNGQRADSPSKTSSNANVTQEETPIVDRYASLISFVVVDHRRVQKEIHDRPQDSKPIVEGQKWSEEIGIRQDEFNLIETYILQTNDKLRVNDSETKMASEEFQRNPTSSDLYTARRLSAMQHNRIITDMVDNLHHELGDESFAKLDKFVKHYWGGRRTVIHPPAGAPHRSANSSEGNDVPVSK